MDSSDENTELFVRKKRLKFRANHRGIKEMDIILGGFANERLDHLDAESIDDFETLLDESDRDLITWVTGEVEFPLPELKPIFEMVCNHTNSKFQKN